jgi:hypothetical protein
MIRVKIVPTKLRPHGQLYSAYDESGRLLVEDNRDPEFSACRALHSEGKMGPVGFHGTGGDIFLVINDIGIGSGLCVGEGKTGGPYIRKWHPFTLGSKEPVDPT